MRMDTPAGRARREPSLMRDVTAHDVAQGRPA